MTSGVVSPPAPESLARRQEPDVRHYAIITGEVVAWICPTCLEPIP